MKTEKLTEKTTEELKKTEKSLKAITGMLLGTLIVLFGLSLYITFTKGFTPLIIIPIALLPIGIVNFNTINNIKKEINSRTKS